jgi:hypothetical protein
MTSLQLLQTARFDRSYARLGPGLTHLAIGAIRDLVNRSRSEPKTWLRRYDRRKEAPTGIVIEVEIAAGPRLLAHVDGMTVTLLEIGRHEIEGRYPMESLVEDIATAHEANAGFVSARSATLRFFGNNRDRTVSEYADELSPQWTYYLTDRQRGILVPMVRDISRASDGNTRLFAILGGPGTGKTSLLVKLLLDLSTRSLRPGIVMSRPVADYVESGTAISLSGAWVSSSTYEAMVDGKISRPRFNVLLIDDPANLGVIESSYDAAIGLRHAVVVAFDPCQFDENEDFDDKAYDRLVAGYEVKEYLLRECYRQKEHLGRAALRVMQRVAESTPYLAEEKVAGFRASHEQVNRIANDLRFPNPKGYEATYPEGKLEDLRSELSRIRGTQRWTHSPSLLVVIDQGCEAARWDWERLLRGVTHRVVRFTEHSTHALRDIKGLEFQHAILAISQALFEDLEHGFRGSGNVTYRRRRLLRIPFSRPKDSLVTLVTASRPEAVIRIQSPFLPAR